MLQRWIQKFKSIKSKWILNSKQNSKIVTILNTLIVKFLKFFLEWIKLPYIFLTGAKIIDWHQISSSCVDYPGNSRVKVILTQLTHTGTDAMKRICNGSKINTEQELIVTIYRAALQPSRPRACDEGFLRQAGISLFLAFHNLLCFYQRLHPGDRRMHRITIVCYRMLVFRRLLCTFHWIIDILNIKIYDMHIFLPSRLGMMRMMDAIISTVNIFLLRACLCWCRLWKPSVIGPHGPHLSRLRCGDSQIINIAETRLKAQ